MGFEQNIRQKQPEYNKDGSIRKHGNTVPFTFRLEPEYINLIESEAAESEIPKSEYTRMIIHDYYKTDSFDNSIRMKILNKIRSKKRKDFERFYGATGESIKEIMTELKRIGNNINQVARKANQGYLDISLANEVEECREMMTRCDGYMNYVIEMFNSLKEQY